MMQQAAITAVAEITANKDMSVLSIDTRQPEGRALVLGIMDRLAAGARTSSYYDRCDLAAELAAIDAAPAAFAARKAVR